MTPTKVYMTLRVQTHTRQKERDDTKSTPPLLLLRLRGYQNDTTCGMPLRCETFSLSLSEERRSLQVARKNGRRRRGGLHFRIRKHRLPFVCASQLHGVQPQHPMFALDTARLRLLALDVVVVPFVPYFRPVWVASSTLPRPKAGGVRGRRLNRRRTVLLLLPFFPSATGAEHPLGRCDSAQLAHEIVGDGERKYIVLPHRARCRHQSV